MSYSIMEWLERFRATVNRARPCKQAISAVEQNTEASRELTASISRFTDTLSSTRPVQRRSGDRPEDEAWKRRRSSLL